MGIRGCCPAAYLCRMDLTTLGWLLLAAIAIIFAFRFIRRKK